MSIHPLTESYHRNGHAVSDDGDTATSDHCNSTTSCHCHSTTSHCYSTTIGYCYTITTTDHHHSTTRDCHAFTFDCHHDRYDHHSTNCYSDRRLDGSDDIRYDCCGFPLPFNVQSNLPSCFGVRWQYWRVTSMIRSSTSFWNSESKACHCHEKRPTP